MFGRLEEESVIRASAAAGFNAFFRIFYSNRLHVFLALKYKPYSNNSSVNVYTYKVVSFYL